MAALSSINFLEYLSMKVKEVGELKNYTPSN